jgi:hypothetical protein
MDHKIQLAYFSNIKHLYNTTMYHLPARHHQLVEKVRGWRLIYPNNPSVIMQSADRTMERYFVFM